METLCATKYNSYDPEALALCSKIVLIFRCGKVIYCLECKMNYDLNILHERIQERLVSLNFGALSGLSRVKCGKWSEMKRSEMK
jgi:hypothetical protein